MAAMFTRNKMIGWTAVVFAVQGWLSETPGQVASGKQPAYFSVGMSVMALAMVCFPSPFLDVCGERREGGRWLMDTVRTELLAAVYPEHEQGGVEYCAGAAGSGCVEGVGVRWGMLRVVGYS